MDTSKFAVSLRFPVEGILNLYTRGMHRTVGIRTQVLYVFIAIGLTLSINWVLEVSSNDFFREKHVWGRYYRVYIKHLSHSDVT